MSMVIHTGGEVVSFTDLQKIEIPPATDSYIPVAHHDLAENIRTQSIQILEPKGYVFVKDQYALAREGQRMFGLFSFKNGTDEFGMAIAFRNSYDRSMSAAIAVGAKVFVCDNLAIHGDITVMRKHTKNVKEQLLEDIILALHRAGQQFIDFHAIVEKLKNVELPLEEGYKILGVLGGLGILSPTILSETFRQWRKPEHECFAAQTGWSFYNAITAGLKAAPPHKIIDVHHRVHEELSCRLLGA